MHNSILGGSTAGRAPNKTDWAQLQERLNSEIVIEKIRGSRIEGLEDKIKELEKKIKKTDEKVKKLEEKIKPKEKRY